MVSASSNRMMRRSASQRIHAQKSVMRISIVEKITSVNKVKVRKVVQ